MNLPHGHPLHSPDADPFDAAPALERRIASLRQQRGWTLKEAAEASGVSASTLSKIERGDLSPTITTLQKIAGGFDLDVIQLLAGQQESPRLLGRRSITRARTGSVHRSPTCINEVMCHDLKHKRMTPLCTTVSARSVDDYSTWPRTDAEIFLFVVKGTLVVNSRLYQPIELGEGDAMYYDASTEHIWTTKGPEDAVVLWLISDQRA